MRGQKQTYPVKLSESGVEAVEGCDATRRAYTSGTTASTNAVMECGGQDGFGNSELDIPPAINSGDHTGAVGQRETIGGYASGTRRKKLDGKQEAL